MMLESLLPRKETEGNMKSEECLHRTNALIFTICCCCLVSKSYPTFLRPPHTVVHQAPLTMGFSRQEYWSGLPFPSPGDLPDPGIEPAAPTASPALQEDSLPLSHQTSHLLPRLENPKDRGGWQAPVKGVTRAGHDRPTNTI